MDPRERAGLVLDATAKDWRDNRVGTKLEKLKGSRRLVIAKAPELIYDNHGEIVGVDAWVQLFDDKGRELPIDPHRRIINPPTVPRSGVRWDNTDPKNPVRTVTPDPVAAFYEAVWDSVEGTPNEKGWRTSGTVTTVFGDTADDGIISGNSTYSIARTGGTLTTGFSFVGQEKVGGGDYNCLEFFCSFNTSAINDSDVVSNVLLDLWLSSDSSTIDFTVEARDYDWGASVTTADWVSGANLGSQTLVASISTSGIGSAGAYKTFASQAAFLSVTNIKTGTVHLGISSSRHRLASVPSDPSQEYVQFTTAEAAGTTSDPKLTITHSSPNAMPFFTSQPNRVWRVF